MSPTSGVVPNAGIERPSISTARIHTATSASVTSSSATMASGSGGCMPSAPADRSHVNPARAGSSTVAVSPRPSVRQATTPSTPTTAPTNADRTGTARLPRPGSTASRVPTSIGAGSVSLPAHRASVGGRRPGRSPRRTVSQAVDHAAAPTAINTTATPAPRTTQSACTPVSSRNRREKATGKRGDRTRAKPTAASAPTTAAMVAGMAMVATAMRWSKPSARHVGRSAAPAVTARTSAWPTSTPPPRRTATAKNTSAPRSIAATFSIERTPNMSSTLSMFTGPPMIASTPARNAGRSSMPSRRYTNSLVGPASCAA